MENDGKRFKHFKFEMADDGGGEILAVLECQNIVSVKEGINPHVMDAIIDGIRFMLLEMGIETPPPEQSGVHKRQVGQ